MRNSLSDESNRPASDLGKDSSNKPMGNLFISRIKNLSPGSRVVLIGATLVILLVFLTLLPTRKSSETTTTKAEETQEEEEAGEVVLSPEALAAAKIEIVGVTQRPAIALLNVTGTVETNAEREQLVTPLVSGRIAAVYVVQGQRVSAGSVLATIQSPQVAELRGQLLEAKSKLALATANAERTRRTANRAGVISAKAKLDLAEKNLERQRRLQELGAGSVKEVQAAEAEYKTAKAEYDYQSDIAISREVQAAESEREAARVTVERLRQSLIALGANPDQLKADPFVTVQAPISGSVVKREVNPGAGVQEGNPLFKIANLSTVWVIANVPESQVNSISVGTPAEVRSPASGQRSINGRISFIDPALNEETRTVRVRVEVANAGEQLKSGMFVEVGFQTGTVGGESADDLVVSDEAIQRIGDRTVVFIPEEDEPGHFQVRDVEIGGVVNGYRRVISGLALEDRVVAKGSFTLKSLLLKGQFEEDDDQ